VSDNAWGALGVAGAVVGTGLLWWLVHWVATRRVKKPKQLAATRQLLQLGVLLIGVVAVVLALPIESQVKGALLGAIGVAIAAVIGLSSTTIVGNALAGLMLRSVDNFKDGDWIKVEGHVGKVTLRRLLATEIETEDSDLMTLPNLFLATHPVKVVKEKGTFISAAVSIGYDVHPELVKRLLNEAAAGLGLENGFTHVLDLGDHAVTYRVYGKLTPVEALLTRRSDLHVAVFDALNGAGVEIVSPQFVNRRDVEGVSPVLAVPPLTAATPADGPDPEEFVFEKDKTVRTANDLRDQQADAARSLEQLNERLKNASDEHAENLRHRVAAAEAHLADLTAQVETADAAVEAVDD
jgi:small-conductance mechanosensitive channel